MSDQKKRKKITLAVIGLILILVLSLITYLVTQTFAPERSVASFCSTINGEKTTLKSTGNYQAKVDAYRKLESVAPNDIRPEIETIRKGYEQIAADPSKITSAGLGMVASENNRDDYIKTNCKEINL
jgi:hypothetical protein